MKRTWMWVAALTSLAILLASPVKAVAEDTIFQIRMGTDYKSYNNDELRRRVWELEKAVSQLQARVYDLEATPAPAPVVIAAPPPQKPWTCRVSAFGRTFVKTLPTRGEAEAQVLQECAADSAEMHCQKIVCSQ